MLMMKKFFLCPLLSLVAFLFASCENKYRVRGVTDSGDYKSSNQFQKSSSLESQASAMGKDAYQVTSEEFDQFFLSRYGLLYQKFSDLPFTGRIVTIGKSEEGDYVSQDESWKEGRKDGVSTRWFSNGIKMYERNYSEGRWHGTVTRWWPNGQKMYVRAYTNGKRHGKEATWRSDGTPAFAPSDSSEKDSGGTKIMEFEASRKSNSLPSVSLPTADSSEPSESAEFDGLPSLSDASEMTPNELESDSIEATVDLPADVELPGFQEDSVAMPPVIEFDSDDSLTLPPMPVEESLPGPDELTPMSADGSFPDNGGLPPLPGDGTGDPGGLPTLPDEMGFPQLSEDTVGLPPLPAADPEESLAFPPVPEDETLPDLGGLPSAMPEDSGGLPPLPVMDSGDPNGLPPLPEESDGLPPLPGMDASGLPPLPAFPE